MQTSELKQIKNRRLARVRAKFHGTAERPRLTVFRSNRYLYAQLVNDALGRTLASARTDSAGKKTDAARAAGAAIAKKAAELGIKEVVFDRGSYRYHGRVQAIAEGARAGGLKF
ncbi:MAG: 50S ribosomal protein L18 [Candidatus Liptonbacteria bacterium RIFCSPHIGHO2_01_FULL_57_28]|uniref:Large ribosomal subunit protein uL18 n=1 Tax=Candidatus Liptonbacteria bacterium RIFCSPHIGHO2_01_FULL_57_28 TaxID=1798647 RepID=A0A1G2CBV7_9BACT|nr:MAG: 50S ribosomal protein L18 [Candidatus Liptonbacteria bacterium RIFCSPHIGHO2_01_FULL_57_28]